MPLVVVGEVGVFGGGEGGREMPSNPRVAMWRRAWPGVSVIWLIGVEVGLLLKEVVVVGVGLIVVMLGGLRVALVLGARRGRPFVVVDGIVGVKDGLVLVVVDHHAADHAADPVAHHLVRAGVQRGLRGYECAACSRQRVFKDPRRGRDNRDRGETLCKESRGSMEALLGGHVFGLLTLLCLVGIKSCCLVLLSPSQGWCTEAPEQLRAPLWVTIIIPATLIYHLNGLHWLRASVAAGGHFSRSSCLSRNGRVMADSNSPLGPVVVSVRLVPVKLPVLTRG